MQAKSQLSQASSSHEVQELTHRFLKMFQTWSNKPANLNKKGLVLSYIPALYRAAFSEEVPLKKYGCAKIKDLVAYLLSEHVEIFYDPEKVTVVYVKPKLISFRECLLQFYSQKLKSVLYKFKKPLRMTQISSMFEHNFKGFQVNSMGFQNIGDLLKTIAKKFSDFKIIEIHNTPYASIQASGSSEEEEDMSPERVKPKPDRCLLELQEPSDLFEEDKESSFSWPQLKKKQTQDQDAEGGATTELKTEIKQLREQVYELKQAVLYLRNQLRSERSQRIELKDLIGELLEGQRKKRVSMMNFGLMGTEETHERGFDEIKSISKQ